MMIEIRRKIEHWEEYTEDRSPIKRTEDPVLQYRFKKIKISIFYTPFILRDGEWSDWIDVEDVHITEGEEG